MPKPKKIPDLDALKEFIKSNIDKSIIDGVEQWLWTGATVTQGGNTWGYVSYNGKTFSAQRAAWIAFADPDLKGQVRKNKLKSKHPLDINPDNHYAVAPKPKKNETENEQMIAPSSFVVSSDEQDTTDQIVDNWVAEAINTLKNASVDEDNEPSKQTTVNKPKQWDW